MATVTKAACLALAVIALSIRTSPSRADADLIKVYSPIVEKGVLELETRGHGSVARPSSNDDVQAHRGEIGYGITDWWHTSLFGEFQQFKGEGLTYNATGFENIFQLTPQGKYFADFGLYLEYRRSAFSSRPDEVETKLLIEKAVSPVVLTANLVFEKEIGRNADTGIDFAYTAVAKIPVTNALSLGVQALGEPGRLSSFPTFQRQEHSIGPVVSGSFHLGNIPGKIEYEFGYLFGITSASARGTPKYIVEYEMPF